MAIYWTLKILECFHYHRKFFRTAVVDFSPIRKDLLLKKKFWAEFLKILKLKKNGLKPMCLHNLISSNLVDVYWLKFCLKFLVLSSYMSNDIPIVLRHWLFIQVFCTIYCVFWSRFKSVKETLLSFLLSSLITTWRLPPGIP